MGLTQVLNLCRQLFGRVPPAGASENQTVIVLVHDQMAELHMDWGPEVDDLIAQLQALVAQHRLGQLGGTEYASQQYRLRFEGPDAQALALAMRPLLCASAMVNSIELFWRPSAQKNIWKRVRLVG